MQKKILVSSEFHKLNTGYGVMYYEMLKRLYANPEYKVAEHATYGLSKHKREHNIEWKFYPNSVEDADPRHKLYESNELNQYGQWRFDQVCLHFKPDIVFGCRDIWMDAHITRSPLSKYYTSILAPPIDSCPQPTVYSECYVNSDYLMPLSQWGCDKIEQELNKKCQLLGFGVDENIFRPMDKELVRQKWGIKKDAVIFGSVMRNQPRKLFPSLIETFAKFLKKDPKRRLNHFLYLHTSYPDKKGWNIPELLTEFGVNSNVYFTYVCKACKRAYSSLWADARTSCRYCDNLAASNPTVVTGLNREDLAEIYNLMDFYIQYSEKEGGGFPIVEAAACNVPVCGPNYSATVSAINNVGGKLIDTYIRRDYSNSTNVAFPNDDHLLQIMENWQNCKHERYRRNVLKEYTWDIVYKRLDKVLQEIKPKNRWGEKSAIHHPPYKMDENLNKKFEDYIYEDVLKTSKFNQEYTQLGRDLYYGCTPTGQKVDKEMVFEGAYHKANHAAWCEKVRQGIIPLVEEDYLNV